MMGSTQRSHKAGQVRIIGGINRRRVIYFPLLPGLRPTPNRIRETLFNWLVPFIEGANCLDLFAGSGALSFEAKSRGAGYCLLLDSSKPITQALIDNIARLKLNNIKVIQAKFPYSQDILCTTFDIIFVDPPFHKGYVQLALDWLAGIPYLNPRALIYVESEEANFFELPENWDLLKSKVAGSVRYSLIRAA
jgi:16S rRNA (guanine966-N2)-methyltransferase